MSVMTASITQSLQLWSGAAAIMIALAGSGWAVANHRRERARWKSLVPAAEPLNARSSELRASRSERLVAPFLDATVATAHRVLRPSWMADSEARIERAGPRSYLTARRLIGIKVIMIPVGMFLGAFVLKGSSADLRLLAAVVVPFLTWRLPDMYLKSLAKARSDQITRELPDVLDQLTISIGAGLGLEAAMNRVAARSRGVLGQELSRTMKDIRIGVDRVVAFESLARRGGAEDLTTVVSSLNQGLEMGMPLAPVFRARSTEIRRKRRAQAEEKAHKLSVKLTFPTALCILPAMLLIVIGPAIIQVATSDFGG